MPNRPYLGKEVSEIAMYKPHAAGTEGAVSCNNPYAAAAGLEMMDPGHRQYIGGYYCSGSLGHSRLECENQYRVSGNYCQLYGGNYSDASHIERRYGESLI